MNIGEEIQCRICGKDISGEVKYSKMGLIGWFCKNCYFRPLKVDDKDLDKSKVVFNYN